MIFRPGMTFDRYQLVDKWKWAFWSNKPYVVDCSKWNWSAKMNMARNIK